MGCALFCRKGAIRFALFPEKTCNGLHLFCEKTCGGPRLFPRETRGGPHLFRAGMAQRHGAFQRKRLRRRTGRGSQALDRAIGSLRDTLPPL